MDDVSAHSLPEFAAADAQCLRAAGAVPIICFQRLNDLLSLSDIFRCQEKFIYRGIGSELAHGSNDGSRMPGLCFDAKMLGGKSI